MPSAKPIYSLDPFVVEKIWGGKRLAQAKALVGQAAPIGETWEISTLVEGPSRCQGVSLRDLMDPADIPYVIKFIDTEDHLSIQVHPDDGYALKHGLGPGKTECWLVLESVPGAGIYLGFRPGVQKSEFKQAILNKESADAFLNFFQVKKGDFFWVPAGMVHAIGAGITLVEVQQSSGVTYRVWDWNRPRELHVEEAFEVLNFDEAFNQAPLNSPKSIQAAKRPLTALAHHAHFEVLALRLEEGESQILDPHEARCLSVVCLEGQIEMEAESKRCPLGEYRSAIVKKGVAPVKITAQGARARVLVVR